MRQRIWTILAILSLLMGVTGLYLAWLGVKSKRPMYAVSGLNLASPSMVKYPNLKILCEGQPVPQVTVTNICFWNAGRETIRSEDIPPKDPIRVSTRRGVDLLSCRVVTASRTAIESQLDQAEWNSPTIGFKFMDKGDWILLQVLHTGTRPEDCFLAGSVVGCPGGIRRVEVPNEGSILCPGRLVSIVVAVESILGMICYYIAKRGLRRKGVGIELGTQAVIVFTAVTVVSFAVIFLASLPYFSARVPYFVLPK